MTPELGPLPPLPTPVAYQESEEFPERTPLFRPFQMRDYARAYAAAEVARLATGQAVGMLAAQEIIIDEMRNVTRAIDEAHENNDHVRTILAAKHNALQRAFNRIGAAAGSLGLIATPSAEERK